MITLTPYTSADRAAYFALYEASFPENERKSPDYMLMGPCASAYDCLVISTSDVRVAGMVITVRDEDYVLLDYLAVSPALRGQGIGRGVLPLVRDRYRDRHLFLEIERPILSCDNLEERMRRKTFYLSAGLVACNVSAYVYGTEMELMSYPESAEAITFEVYASLFEKYFPAGMTPRRVEERIGCRT